MLAICTRVVGGMPVLPHWFSRNYPHIPPCKNTCFSAKNMGGIPCVYTGLYRGRGTLWHPYTCYPYYHTHLVAPPYIVDYLVMNFLLSSLAISITDSGFTTDASLPYIMRNDLPVPESLLKLSMAAAMSLLPLR